MMYDILEPKKIDHVKFDGVHEFWTLFKCNRKKCYGDGKDAEYYCRECSCTRDPRYRKNKRKWTFVIDHMWDTKRGIEKYILMEVQ